MRRGGGGCRRQTGRKRRLSRAAPGCGQARAASAVEWHTVRGQNCQAVCLDRPDLRRQGPSPVFS